MTRLFILIGLGLHLGAGISRAGEHAPAALDACNVVWTTPSADASGSMPIGNGEVGLNAWVEGNGDLLFYIARTDAWSESSRLMKLGRVRVSLSPNPFVTGAPFRQELKLRDGQIVITAGDAELHLLVDADSPVIHLTGESKTPRKITVTLETWRNERRRLTPPELDSSWAMRKGPESVQVWESADVVASDAPGAVVWYHRNESSCVPFTLKQQGIDSLASLVKDPLANRTFGGRITGDGLVRQSPNVLASAQPVTKFSVAIATQSAQTATVADWEKQIPAPVDAATAAQRTTAWWNEFWDRSWISVEGGSPEAAAGSSQVTQAYVLQRWMTACAGRGNYPIKFNGSLFTVEPKFAGGPDCSPDWRKWGDSYWWQNTRLPYFPMAERGDFDEMRTLFRFYENALPLCEARAKLYYHADGVYFPETMTIFGTYANMDYGWDRQGMQPSDVHCPYWKFAWQQGLELTALMLNYYEYTQDKQFLNDELIPMANAVLRYYDTRFSRDANGKLVISPTQSIETYWTGVVNDTPSVAGLHDVCARLLALPASESDLKFWAKVKAAAPDLPIKDGKVEPAEKFDAQRHNVENPELYAIWPFHLFGVGQPGLDVGIKTFQDRIVKASTGWQYDGQCAAILGLTDEAQSILLGKVGRSNPHFRFPAMWGPNYDWLPDQDHGSNIMLTLQHMLIENSGDKIYLLPAWPTDWNVSFKLHAPQQTTVTCEVRAGKVIKLDVQPPARAKDVVLPANFSR